MLGVLVIEDDDRMVGTIRSWVHQIDPTCSVTVAGDRDSAIRILRDGDSEFDLVICDLKIPPSRGSLDGREVFGVEVHEVARSELPGTPCMFFTGHADDYDTYDQIARGPNVDLYGCHEMVPLVQLIRKLDFDKAAAYLRDMAEQWQVTDAVAADVRGIVLDGLKLRPLRILARRLGGARLDAEPLGGLSGATTFRAQVFDNGSARRATVFGKIANHAAIREEQQRFRQYIAVHLDPSAIPTESDTVTAGAGRSAAIFYSLAEKFAFSLFDLVERDDGRAAAVVEALRQLTLPWHDAAQHEAIRIEDLRRSRISDGALQPFLDDLNGSEFSTEELEQSTVTTKVLPQHGDLHGANVLLDNHDRIMLIDFGDVGIRAAGFDPVVLGTSLVFHRDRPAAFSTWPNAEQAAQWSDADAYSASSPRPEVLRACRRWAAECSPDCPGLNAAVLAYVDALRQLKYPDTRKNAAIAIARSAGIRALELLR